MIVNIDIEGKKKVFYLICGLMMFDMLFELNYLY